MKASFELLAKLSELLAGSYFCLMLAKLLGGADFSINVYL